LDLFALAIKEGKRRAKWIVTRNYTGRSVTFVNDGTITTAKMENF